MAIYENGNSGIATVRFDDNTILEVGQPGGGGSGVGGAMGLYAKNLVTGEETGTESNFTLAFLTIYNETDDEISFAAIARESSSFYNDAYIIEESLEAHSFTSFYTISLPADPLDGDIIILHIDNYYLYEYETGATYYEYQVGRGILFNTPGITARSASITIRTPQ